MYNRFRKKRNFSNLYFGASLVAQKKKICLQCMRPGFDPLVRKINFCLENPMDRGVWQATVHGVTKSD